MAMCFSRRDMTRDLQVVTFFFQTPPHASHFRKFRSSNPSNLAELISQVAKFGMGAITMIHFGIPSDHKEFWNKLGYIFL